MQVGRHPARLQHMDKMASCCYSQALRRLAAQAANPHLRTIPPTMRKLWQSSVSTCWQYELAPAVQAAGEAEGLGHSEPSAQAEEDSDGEALAGPGAADAPYTPDAARKCVLLNERTACLIRAHLTNAAEAALLPSTRMVSVAAALVLQT